MEKSNLKRRPTLPSVEQEIVGAGKVTDQMAFDYHQFPRPGKFEIFPTKPMETQVDLSLAYSPGVAMPCLEI